mmetsp:Transcript_31194/g.78503  ORF Transcript_31194/g.78503 Transcript_31194/m.78503 type:complete len:293 (-) Transcript_31194:487-1365(-)
MKELPKCPKRHTKRRTKRHTGRVHVAAPLVGRAKLFEDDVGEVEGSNGLARKETAVEGLGRLERRVRVVELEVDEAVGGGPVDDTLVDDAKLGALLAHVILNLNVPVGRRLARGVKHVDQQHALARHGLVGGQPRHVGDRRRRRRGGRRGGRLVGGEDAHADGHSRCSPHGGARELVASRELLHERGARLRRHLHPPRLVVVEEVGGSPRGDRHQGRRIRQDSGPGGRRGRGDGDLELRDELQARQVEAVEVRDGLLGLLELLEGHDARVGAPRLALDRCARHGAKGREEVP